MKKLLMYAMLFAVAFVLGCSDNDDMDEKAEKTSLTITIQNESSSNSRLVGDGSVNTPLEQVLSNLTVFVFNYNTGTLEKIQSFTLAPGDYVKVVTGLMTNTQKRVVAFVNVPTSADLSTVMSYNDLGNNLITLDSQNSASDLSTVGLFMSGEYGSAITLSPSSVQQISIGVKRRVAKVILSSLKVDPVFPADQNLLTLTGVSIQRARLTGTPIGQIVPPVGDPTVNYAGGLASSSGSTPSFNLTRSYLVEPITVDFSGYTPGSEIIEQASDQKYFYVLPNNNNEDLATLLSINGAYNGVQAYYPFIVNDDTNVPGVLESNVRYVLSVKLVKINLPSTDPNDVLEDASLEITLVPENWEGPINQDIEW